MFWPLQENVITEKDLDDLILFIQKTSRFTQYEKVKQFEDAYSEWQGCRYSVFVNSGSSANLLLVNALKELRGWQAGDEVIVPSVTWPTTVTPIIQLGLQPIFVDANLTDLALDYDQVERKVTSRTRAIFVAHLIGFPADVQRLSAIAKNHGIALLEDCCESQGAVVRGKKVGNWGSGGTFSSYWGHHMTTVEGGVVCTDDEELYKLCLMKRSHGLARELPLELHNEVRTKNPDIDFNFLFLTDGLNLRNTEFNAVLGLGQLKRLNKFIEIRNQNYAQFLDMCWPYADDLIVLTREGMSSFVLPFLFRNRQTKLEFQDLIRAAGIESRPLISGNLLRQPFLSRYYNASEFPNADFIHSNAFYIGNNQFVGTERLDVLDGLLRKFFGQQRKSASS